MADSSQADGLAFLQTTDENGMSVYSQLTDVIASILLSKPADALESFEAISQKVKAGQFSAASTVVPPAPIEVSAAETAWEEADGALFKVSRWLLRCLLRPDGTQRCASVSSVPQPSPCAAEHRRGRRRGPLAAGPPGRDGAL